MSSLDPSLLVADLSSLSLPCINSILNEKNDSSLLNVMFVHGEYRLQLLSGILIFIDGDLEKHFQTLSSVKLIKDLTSMYLDMKFITPSEKGFITGEISEYGACSVWSRIISVLRDFKNAMNNDLNEEYNKCFSDLYDLVSKECFMDNLNSVNKFKMPDSDIISVNVNHILDQITSKENEMRELEEELQKLSENENICSSEVGYVDSSTSTCNVHLMNNGNNEISFMRGNETRSLDFTMNNFPENKSKEGSRTMSISVDQLLEKWKQCFQYWWKMNFNDNLHSMHHSFFANRTSNLEESVNEDLTEVIHSLHKNYSNISGLISGLKQIKESAKKMLNENEDKRFLIETKKLHQFLTDMIGQS